MPPPHSLLSLRAQKDRERDEEERIPLPSAHGTTAADVGAARGWMEQCQLVAAAATALSASGTETWAGGAGSKRGSSCVERDKGKVANASACLLRHLSSPRLLSLLIAWRRRGAKGAARVRTDAEDASRFFSGPGPLRATALGGAEGARQALAPIFFAASALSVDLSSVAASAVWSRDRRGVVFAEGVPTALRRAVEKAFAAAVDLPPPPPPPPPPVSSSTSSPFSPSSPVSAEPKIDANATVAASLAASFPAATFHLLCLNAAANAAKHERTLRKALGLSSASRGGKKLSDMEAAAVARATLALPIVVAGRLAAAVAGVLSEFELRTGGARQAPSASESTSKKQAGRRKKKKGRGRNHFLALEIAAAAAANASNVGVSAGDADEIDFSNGASFAGPGFRAGLGISLSLSGEERDQREPWVKHEHLAWNPWR